MSNELTHSQTNLVGNADFHADADEKTKDSVRAYGFTADDLKKLASYNIDEYENDVIGRGLKNTWIKLNNYVLNYENANPFLDISRFAELYETGLAITDKQLKKESGQYYTPDDVAAVMADWFRQADGENICDVACGTGKLILTYLDIIGREKAIDLIRSGKLYLYDSDSVALSICKTILLSKYGKESEPFIHVIQRDFLDKNIVLPANCKVISNPPYANIKKLKTTWKKTEVASETKELYSVFMEKIITQSVSSVIITPYSFISGEKFYPLRVIMNNYSGFIVSFDNVPGNIFCGRKHGIFNTNTSNSVRAAITVVQNKKETPKGFMLTPLIRFKNEERNNLLNTEILGNFICEERQTVSETSKMFCKCEKALANIWNSWKNISGKTLGFYVKDYGQHILSMPNTCRYYTTAYNGILNRKGQIVLKIENRDVFNYVYCMINSSFAYWYWRMYDGGINYTRKLLLTMPVFFDILSDEDKSFFNETAEEMIESANKYIITKNNVGVQENIKYPRKYRDAINKRILNILQITADEKIFDSIHSNTALKVNL